jgi:hypothetical protein
VPLRQRINFEVSSFYDAGFDVRLGDYLNEFLVKDKVETWADVEALLRFRAGKGLLAISASPRHSAAT